MKGSIYAKDDPIDSSRCQKTRNRLTREESMSRLIPCSRSELTRMHVMRTNWYAIIYSNYREW